MPRIRSLHPEQWSDDGFVELTDGARLLALAVRNFADDNGIFEWNMAKLKMWCFPADNRNVANLVTQLTNHNVVRRYECDGRDYGQIRNFLKYQRVKSPTFRYPAPVTEPDFPIDPRYKPIHSGNEAPNKRPHSGNDPPLSPPPFPKSARRGRRRKKEDTPSPSIDAGVSSCTTEPSLDTARDQIDPPSDDEPDSASMARPDTPTAGAGDEPQLAPPIAAAFRASVGLEPETLTTSPDTSYPDKPDDEPPEDPFDDTKPNGEDA